VLIAVRSSLMQRVIVLTLWWPTLRLLSTVIIRRKGVGWGTVISEEQLLLSPKNPVRILASSLLYLAYFRYCLLTCA
jgi:hypothetical protein